MSEKLDPANAEKTISEEEFDRRAHELTEALDNMEKEAFPPKSRPAPIGGMF